MSTTLVEELAWVWIGVPALDDTAARLRDLLGLEDHASGTLAPDDGPDRWAGRRWSLLGPSGFSYGTICLVEGEARPDTGALPRGWDSVMPVGRRFPNARRGTGPVFEVHLRSGDHDAARRLYGESLGMPALMAADFTESRCTAPGRSPTASRCG